MPASAFGSQTTIEQPDDNKDDSITDDSSAMTAATATVAATESRDSRSLAASKLQAQEKKPEKK